jgi:phosphatidylinositol alpha-mannosyltransferase
VKIVHFTSAFLPQVGGAEIAVHDIASMQSRLGHDVSVLVSFKSWMATSRTAPYRTIPLFPASNRLSFLCATVPALRRVMALQVAAWQRRHRFDIWHIHYAYPAAYVAIDTLHRMRVGCVVTCHGADVQQRSLGKDTSPQPGPVRGAVREALLKADAVTALSTDVRNGYAALGVQEDHITNIPHFIDVDRFRRAGGREKMRATLGIKDNEKLILSLGRHHPIKGLEIIPDVIKELRRERDDFVWLVVGSGTKALLTAATREKTAARLRVMPPIVPPAGSGEWAFPSEKLLRVYNAADLLVAPSRQESFGRVMLEGMAAGLPVVGTDIPAFRELMSGETPGILTPVDDYEAMAKVLNQLLDSDAMRRTLGASACRTACQYTPAAVMKDYTAVYKRVAKHYARDAQET